MGSDATLKAKDGQVAEAGGLSILDVVKHAVKTVIETLGDEDRLSIVEFNRETKVALALTSMNATGKRTAQRALDGLEADYDTNLWGGLECGLNVLRQGAGSGKNSVLLLLTDGEPTVLPELTHGEMLRNYVQLHGSFCSIHTFGFGYQLDSELLNGLSSDGKGTYSFIPDCSLVGTVFVNTLANLLCTASNDLELVLNFQNDVIVTECLGGQECAISDRRATLSLGSIHFDQERNFIFKCTGANNNDPYVQISLNYSVAATGEKNTIELTGVERIESNELFEFTRIRLELVTYLRQIMQLAQSKRFDDALKVIADFVDLVKASKFSQTELVTDLLQDVEGQISEAVCKEEWYFKWGMHYLPSLLNAHLNQYCNNFKDPGIQHYGGALFTQIRDNLDELFVKLPPPRPTGFAAQMLQHQQRAQAQVNMRQYHHQGGG